VQNDEQDTQGALVDEGNGLWELDVPEERGQELQVAEDQLRVHGSGLGRVEAVSQESANEIAVSDNVQPVEGESGHTSGLENEERLP
jgi:hypothetical protein